VIVADGVTFTAAQAAAALRLANESTRSELLALGIAPRQASVILEKRPFADVGAMAATPFIGEKTLEHLRDGR
jgi:DNA uptake protein ComE-like DNA-binding protein